MKFTVFTPTFNRAHTLNRVYESLRLQVFKDFEWLIVDDGSTDDTKLLVDFYIKSHEIPVSYFYQENQGKHVAINEGVAKANGFFFLIADSDDTFPPDALKVFNDTWNSIPPNRRDDFSGVTGLCADLSRKVIGTKFPSSPFDSSTSDNIYVYGIKGEKWGFQRTDVLKKYPFPSYSNQKFIPEGVIWKQIGKNYKTRYVNHIVRFYHEDASERLTSRSLHNLSKSRKIYAYTLENDLGYFGKAPWMIFKLALQGTRYSCHQGDAVKCQLSWLESSSARLIWLIAFPFGLSLYFFDKIKHVGKFGKN